MTFNYTPHGVCSRKMTFEIENGIVKDLQIVGGCNGNLKGIAKLVTGLSVEEVISRLSGIDCSGRGTSCPDQIAQALEKFAAENGI